MQNWQIEAGNIFADRRGNTYTVITVAKDVQTEEHIVVYSQNFGQEMVLCCPADAFLVSMTPAEQQKENMTLPRQEFSPAKDAHSMMLDFLDTSDFSLKVKILKEMYILGELTNGIIDNMAASLDFVIEEGDLAQRYEQLRLCVETRGRYETLRLR